MAFANEILEAMSIEREIVGNCACLINNSYLFKNLRKQLFQRNSSGIKKVKGLLRTMRYLRREIWSR